ncbi:hypothetical protein GCM10023116_31400 [Kistimonas scapharcae]|uniref:Uncharacterized protein n=1 Tax=Kistimonas scapharcae TaxID=1036133 RepID=A0ABP8V4X6_9GAMM
MFTSSWTAASFVVLNLALLGFVTAVYCYREAKGAKGIAEQ